MNLVYNEYIKFLNDKGLKEQTNIELKEGYYWYDNSIRISYNENLTFEEIDRFIICLYNCIDLLKRMSGYENK